MTVKHWFHSKSPAAKKAYIAAHPKSIYAKEAKAARGDKQRAKTAKTNRAAHNAVMKERRELSRVNSGTPTPSAKAAAIEARKARHEFNKSESERRERMAERRKEFLAAEKRVKPNSAPIRARHKPNK